METVEILLKVGLPALGAGFALLWWEVRNLRKEVSVLHEEVHKNKEQAKDDNHRMEKHVLSCANWKRREGIEI